MVKIKKIIKMTLWTIIILLLLIGPFATSGFGNKQDKLIDIVQYYLGVIILVIIPVILITNVKKIRDRLPLFKRHKLSTTILASIVTYFIFAAIYGISYIKIVSLYSDEYYAEVAKAETQKKEVEKKVEIEKKKAIKKKTKKEVEKTIKTENHKEDEKEKVKKSVKEDYQEKETEKVPPTITGDIIQDAQNGALFVGTDKSIVDYQGNKIDEYTGFIINDDGTVSTEYYVVEGVYVMGKNIVYAVPSDVPELSPGETALARLDSTEDVGTARDLIRNSGQYEGKCVKIQGTVHTTPDKGWYISAGDSLNNWLILYDIRSFDSNGVETKMMDGDLVDVTGIFYSNTGYYAPYDTTLHSLTDTYVVLDKFWN